MAQDTRRQKRPNGEAQPFKNEKSGRWELFVELPPVNGKRRRKKVSGATKTEAREKARAVRDELAQFGSVADSITTVDQLLDQWLAAIPEDVTLSTLEAYTQRARLYVRPYLGRRRVRDLQPKDVSKWLSDLKNQPPPPQSKGRSARRVGPLSAGTRRAARGTLVAALTWGQREGVVNRNVAAIAQGPKGGSPRVDPLDLDEVRVLLEAVNGWRYSAAVALMVGLGLRIGETIGLMWGDLDLKADPPTVSIQRQLRRGESGVRITGTKTSGSTRTVALPAFVVSQLKAHQKAQNEERLLLGAGRSGPGDLVFSTPLGTPVDGSNFRRELGKLTADAGLKGVHPHRLRHSAVAVLLDAGVPLDVVSETVGHSSIRITKDTYGKLLNTGKARVADAMDQAVTGEG